VLGLLGPFLFASVSCAIVGLLVIWAERIAPRNSVEEAIAGIVIFLVGSGSYFAVMLALHLYASCQLPISIRLAMIYLTIFTCLSAAIWSTGEVVTSASLLGGLLLCLGGFALRRFRSWRALSWNQAVAKPKMTIFSLLDVTAAIALTLGLVPLEEVDFDPGGLVCTVPGLIVFAGFGLHVWARLMSLCPIRQHAGTGFGIWMAVNVLWAFLVFVSFAVGFSTSPAGLLGFIAAPGSLLVAHVWTEIPLRWLRGCGWVMVRIDEADTENSESANGLG
jgi:hypothetical protein